ncbi:polysaccharide biosynthesis tyrosine autokinase [Brevibacillus dissolubilis]|uniref:polysaccharide biosynthesis tyrosine autokinase n=1 Tax=Brevibacillus dissolubilis TaxID=1844116 RepID=UPI001115E35E|nr:polysaccharide biosynthesis tyrosine autokinase [Brevibacillus dissolubilis]
MEVRKVAELDIKAILNMIKRRLWIIVVCTLISTSTIAFVSQYYIKPTFEASTMLLISRNNDKTAEVISIADIERDSKLVDTYNVIIKSRPIMEKAAERLQASIQLKLKPSTLSAMTNVTRLKTSQVVKITVSYQDYHKAVEIANTITKVAQTEVSQFISEDNIQILELAVDQDNPVPIKPNKKMNIILGFFLGFFTSLGIIFVLAYLNDSIEDEKDVEMIIDVPVLGSIPKTAEGARYLLMDIDQSPHAVVEEVAVTIDLPSRRSTKKLKPMVGWKNGLRDRLGLRKSQHTGNEDDLQDAFRTLRTNLQYSLEKPVHTILVTNPGPGKGNPITAVNLSVSLAQIGKKVLLVDADLRNPRIHQFFRMNNQRGLTNLLLAEIQTPKQVTQKTNVNNLSVITSGPVVHSQELLTSNRMADLLTDLREEYDYILIDAPPIISVSDAQTLAPIVDGVLMIIQSGKTNREILTKAKDVIRMVNGKIIGIVLNHPKNSTTRFVYKS